MLEDFDHAGLKNLALALMAFELALVDGGAATAAVASFLALSPIQSVEHANSRTTTWP
ncbi:MAG: hypothetical protein ABSE46_06995 [Terracidiphilus sp.]|jgi:hypothetical protein